ncbi:MAG: sigma 54-interacting transcriptional regulator [Gemmatimonadota bacterium]|nr:MAG: sigma 54-interacting transcriptional regulator [Gemmatimonadota bacterium]
MQDRKEQIRKALELSYFTIQRAPDAIFWIDMEGRIHRVNEAACRLLGYSRGELTGMEAYKLYREENDEIWRKRWTEFEKQKIFTFESCMFTKDGHPLPVEVSRNYFEFEGKKFTCSFVRDITERKRSEESLKNALTEVEQLKNQLEKENLYLQDEIKLTHNFEEIISRDDGFKKVLAEVEQVAATEATVLILGETGTGKELIARAIHNISSRRDRPLVKVNCAAIPANLIESELFGHEKGAFTGAFARKIGRFELASGGTIFLDEIGDLSMDLQAKLLRVLQDGEFERVGSSSTIKVDVRVLAATNRDLDRALEIGTFREDLYYRLSVFPIRIPPLRDRRDDIPILLTHFIKRYATKTGKRIEKIPQKVVDSLQAYHWPGNVRELENVIERAVIISKGNKLELGRWFPRKDTPSEKRDMATLEDMERAHILKVLELTGWRVSGERGAAKILGINPNTLVSRLKKLNIHR